MKLAKLLGIGVLTLMAPVLATTASAATLTCQPTSQNSITNFVITSPIVFNCPASGGATVTAVSLDMLVSFNDGVVGTIHQVTGTATSNSLQFALAPLVVTTASGDVIGDGRTTGFGGVVAPVSVGGLNLLGGVNAFTVSAATVIPAGFVIPDNASITIQYNTTETTSTVPEPASMVLLGSGLAALAVSARRRRARLGA